MDVVTAFFCNTSNNDFVQLIGAFCTGVLFSPWSWGLRWFVAFLIVYEVLAIYFTRCDSLYWKFSTRIGVVCASLLGFILGRILVGYDNPLVNENDDMTVESDNT